MTLAETSAQVGALAVITYQWLADILPRLIGGLIILVLGYAIAGWVGRVLSSLLGHTDRIDPTLAPVLIAIARYAIIILAFVALLGQLGVQTASVLTVLGAAGLAIGLALQGTLANIAAGLMLLWLRPFRAGEYIETPTVSGQVMEVGLFNTRLDTFDGVYRFVPNQELWSKPIINYTRNPSRLINISFELAHRTDLAEARKIILAIAAEDNRIRRTPPPEFFVDKLNERGSICFFRGWVRTADYWPVHKKTIEEIKTRCEAAGIKFAP